jgi:hypothetical protein
MPRFIAFSWLLRICSSLEAVVHCAYTTNADAFALLRKALAFLPASRVFQLRTFAGAPGIGA